MPLASLTLTPALLRLIASIDEFKGRWQAFGTLAPDRLSALRRVATIESVGSSTRIEGAKLSDAEVDRLLSGLDVRSFRSRDEQEVAGYAAAMELVFSSWREITLTEGVTLGLVAEGALEADSDPPLHLRGEVRRHLSGGYCCSISVEKGVADPRSHWYALGIRTGVPAY
jgi:hypothetical protein